MCRVIAGTLLLSILGLLFFPSAVEAAPSPLKNGIRKQQVREAPDVPEYSPQDTHYEPPAEDIREPEKPAIMKHAPSHQTPIVPKRPNINIEEAVLKLKSLYPDEVRTKGILSPLTATGEALLRDLAFRTRAFREALAAWEALHFVIDGPTLSQRDIIPQLRAAKLPSENFAEAVHSYDRFRAYINKLAARLFPWTMAFYADHMSLHASFYSGGKGIVLTAGDGQAPYLLTSIPSFRKLGCELPIEILYLGDEDLSEDYRDALEALPGVLTRDLSQMVNDEGWALKGMVQNRFS